MFQSPHKLVLLFACASFSLANGEPVKDDLIKLRLKKLERIDRLPEPSENVVLTTEVPSAVKLPDYGIPSDWPEERFAEVSANRLKNHFAEDDLQKVTGLFAEGFRFSTETSKLSPAKFLKWVGEFEDLKLKVLGVEGPAVQLHVEANSADSEYSARWKCTWVSTDPDSLLARIEVLESSTAQSNGIWFVDATRGVIGKNKRFDAQVLRGIEFWTQRITRIGDLSMTGHHGIAVGDVNGDGLEDLYVCDGGSLPNQLYLQQKDGTALEVAEDWDVAWLEDSRGALLIDLDNDGDQDLVVATIAMIAFAENNGTGKFVLRGGFPGAPYPFSLSAADFDSDGDLDLYTCLYSAGDDVLAGKTGFEAQSPIPFDDAENGGRNVLLENLGNFQFRDVTGQVGLEVKNTRWSFAAAWEDYDRDGDPDLYVANDFGRNCLYRNDGGRFQEISESMGVEDIGAGMSVAWGDFNCDGEADLQIGNMFSSAGRRVALQRDFDPKRTRMARGNSLFSRKGKSFEDVSEEVGNTVSGWAWSSAFADLDNDGWQDLVVANGYMTNTRDHDL